MNGDSLRYTIDEGRIVSEIIDGEAVIINLANGYYYSLDTSAAEIWGWLQSGRSISEIVSAIQRRYDCSSADPEAAVRAFIGTLVTDDLVAPCPDAASPQGLEPLGAASAETSPFRAPSLQRFSDMQGFLLVDPVHEVDERGWPHTKPGGLPTSRG